MKSMCFIWFQIFVGVGVQLAEKAKQRPVINYFSNPKYLPVNLPVCKSAAFEIIKYPVSLILFIYPRPTKGILVAITVIKSTFASKGSPAICTTAFAAFSTSIVGSTAVSPLG